MSFEQFDFFQGRAEAAAGMQRASEADRVQEWKIAADEWFDSLEAGVVFTSDHLRRACGVPDEGANRVNVVGAFISGLSAKHRIVFTGRFVKSSAVTRHTGTQREWKKIW